MNEPVYIVDGIRTPFAKARTFLSEIDAVELGKTVVSQLIAKTGLQPEKIDEVIFGCVAQPPDAPNIARSIALRAGVPASAPAFTVHRNCASGFEAVTQAADKIAAGRGDIFLVGGIENMSRVPLFYSYPAAQKFGDFASAKDPARRLRAAAQFRVGDFRPQIGLRLGLSDPVCGLSMGETAEKLSREFGITREEQDMFAMRSHHRAIAARPRLSEEITPVYLPKSKNGKTYLGEDNGPRENQTVEALAKLKPVFEPNIGTVTAGNSSQITDGAAALIIMSEKGLRDSGLAPLGRLLGYAYAGLDPSRMGLGPVYAIDRAERRLGLGLKDADLIEINEAFAAQVLACQKAAASTAYCRDNLNRESILGEIPNEILNVNGGAIALGHPVGVTGARLVLTALKELRRRGANRALASLCVGGGQGGALWLTRN